MAWIELWMNATEEGLDWVCIALASQAASPQLQISKATSPNWPFQVQIYLERAAPRSAVDQIQAALAPLQRTGLISAPETYLSDQQPAAAPPQQQIGRFVLSPTQPLAAEQIPLYLPPSPAFGHGSHPATRLALQLIQRHVTAGMQSLDLGTGTGILALAMAKLGAEVLALDNEPAAVAAAMATMQLNQAEQVTVQLGSLGQGSELGHWMGGELDNRQTAFAPAAQFDLIAANILARIHMALASDYQKALRPSGILITAGYTSEFETEIQDALAQAEFQLIEAARVDDWVALAHRLSAP